MILPPAILEAEQKATLDKMPPEMQQAIQKFDMAIQQKDQAINAASDKIQELMIENEKLKSQDEIKRAEVVVKEQQVEVSKFEAETARMLAESQVTADSVASDVAAHTAINPPTASQPAAPALDVNALLQTISAMQNPENINIQAESMAAVVQVTSQLSNAVDTLAQVASTMTQPKHKTGRAVKQPDGSFLMESLEVTE